MNCVIFREASDNRLTASFVSEDGSDIDAATVSVTIIDDETGESVDGQPWPTFMTLVGSLPTSGPVPEVERPNSSYTYVFPKELEIVRRKFYTAQITMTSTLGDRYVEKLIKCVVE